MRISDWSSDVCSSDLQPLFLVADVAEFRREGFDEVAARDLSQPHDAAQIGTGRQRGMIERGIGLEQRPFGIALRGDRQSDVSGKSVPVRDKLGGARTLTKKNHSNIIKMQ